MLDWTLISLGLLAALATSLVLAIAVKVWQGGRRSGGSVDALHHRIRGLEADLRVAQRAADDALNERPALTERTQQHGCRTGRSQGRGCAPPRSGAQAHGRDAARVSQDRAAAQGTCRSCRGDGAYACAAAGCEDRAGCEPGRFGCGHRPDRAAHPRARRSEHAGGNPAARAGRRSPAIRSAPDCGATCWSTTDGLSGSHRHRSAVRPGTERHRRRLHHHAVGRRPAEGKPVRQRFACAGLSGCEQARPRLRRRPTRRSRPCSRNCASRSGSSIRAASSANSF